ncbi:AIR carboxylase family protein [Candidatus Peregrinibacteria bacterium]|nr:AIR carboxylase family protein [Candidatus Peregrinibacteria bacterium]
MKVVFLLGSKSDSDFSGKMVSFLEKWNVQCEVVVASAHKVPEKVFSIINENNKKEKDLVYITIAGRSNGLSGVVAANSVHPVIACPPFQDKVDFMVNINSTLMMPSDTPVMTVIDPINAALSALKIFGISNAKIREKLKDKIKEIKKSFES